MKNYLLSMKFHIVFVLVLFFLSMGLGYIYASENPQESTELMEELEKFFSPMRELSSIHLFLLIFVNNTVKSFGMMLLGLGFGIVPLGFIVFNGVLVGIVIYIVKESHGWVIVFLGILPHGIFEIPAVVLSAAIGLKLGGEVLNAILGKEADINKEFKAGISLFFRIVVPLLLIAAVVESCITSLLV
ncbi:MAG: stage II sporulation protein M [Candidatus Syntropharchaeia archaeon]